MIKLSTKSIEKKYNGGIYSFNVSKINECYTRLLIRKNTYVGLIEVKEKNLTSITWQVLASMERTTKDIVIYYYLELIDNNARILIPSDTTNLYYVCFK